jgi:hypothetical protein
LIRDAITLSDLGESFSIVGDTHDIREKAESVFALMRNAPERQNTRPYPPSGPTMNSRNGLQTTQVPKLLRSTLWPEIMNYERMISCGCWQAEDNQLKGELRSQPVIRPKAGSL